MTKARLETFSDGVVAILITIMVLELRAPGSPDVAALASVRSHLLTYVLSFVFLGIYWNNHHHMLHLADRIDGKVLWANLHLLFWLSLVPFVTSWMGETGAAPVPVAAYGAVLLCAALAYYLLKMAIISVQGPDSRLQGALGTDLKGKVSPLLYTAAIVFAFVERWIAIAIYILVALMWLVPDPRVEAALRRETRSAAHQEPRS